MSTLTSKEETQLSFVADWHDETADVTRRFALNYFPRDNSVEMVRETEGAPPQTFSATTVAVNFLPPPLSPLLLLCYSTT